MASGEISVAFDEETLELMRMLRKAMERLKEKEQELLERLEVQELRVIKLENQLKELGKL